MSLTKKYNFIIKSIFNFYPISTLVDKLQGTAINSVFDVVSSNRSSDFKISVGFFFLFGILPF